jgi:hypothetical protein
MLVAMRKALLLFLLTACGQGSGAGADSGGAPTCTASSGPPVAPPKHVIAATTALGGKIYAVMGDVPTGGSVMTYDVTLGTWTTLSSIPTDQPIYEIPVAAAATASNLYVLFDHLTGAKGTSFLAYEFTSAAWQTLPTFEFIAGGTPMGLVAVGTKVYGPGSAMSSVRGFYVYDEPSNTWSALNAPLSSFGLGSALLPAATPDGRVFALGVTDDQVYDIASMAWTAVAEEPAPSGSASPVVFDGQSHIYAFGLPDEMTASLQKTTQVLDVSTLKWSFGPPTPVPLTGGSLSFAVLGCDDRLYVFDGPEPYPGSMMPTQTTLRLDLASQTWETSK